MWEIKATTRSNGNKAQIQQSLVPKKKLRLIDADDLQPDEWFFQVFGNIVTRKLKFSPEEFTDKKKYKKELNIIGVWVEKLKVI